MSEHHDLIIQEWESACSIVWECIKNGEPSNQLTEYGSDFPFKRISLTRDDFRDLTIYAPPLCKDYYPDHCLTLCRTRNNKKYASCIGTPYRYLMEYFYGSNKSFEPATTELYDLVQNQLLFVKSSISEEQKRTRERTDIVSMILVCAIMISAIIGLFLCNA